MLSNYRYLTFLTAFVFFSCAFAPNSYGDGYKGFKLLNPDECTPLENKVISKLPVKWHKYADFIKICNLKENRTTNSKVSIICIWAHDYQKKLSPDAMWENYPLPIIVDNNLRQIGNLPELYPMDWVTHLDVYYGKWKRGIPAIIMIDVVNPAVSGDYYYEPLKWNYRNGRYEIKITEPITGKRPRKIPNKQLN